MDIEINEEQIKKNQVYIRKKKSKIFSLKLTCTILASFKKTSIQPFKNPFTFFSIGIGQLDMLFESLGILTDAGGVVSYICVSVQYCC